MNNDQTQDLQSILQELEFLYQLRDQVNQMADTFDDAINESIARGNTFFLPEHESIH